MKMRISKIGERKVIEEFSEIFSSREWVEIGIGDDAAVLRAQDGKVVVTSDICTESSHFPRGMSPEQKGFFSITVNASDLAAMGARPIAFLLSISAPRETELEELLGIARGAERACVEYGAPLVGGDTKEGKELVLAGFGIGIVKRPLTLSGAKPGDGVYLSGSLGRVGLGIISLLRGLGIKKYEEAALNPRARVDLGTRLQGVATSATDVTDGLALELWKISSKSGVRIEIEEVPMEEEYIEECIKHGIDPLELALHYGGDLELVFTSRDEEEISSISEELGVKITKIGSVFNGRGVFLNGKEIEPRGYEHFSEKNNKSRGN